MSIKITSPIEGFQGTSTYGPVTLTFTDGTAEVEELSEPLRAYLSDRGYSIDGKPKRAGRTTAKPANLPEGEPTDKWTHDQLDAYAEANGVELTSGLAKEAKLVAILEAATTPDDDQSDDDQSDDDQSDDDQSDDDVLGTDDQPEG